MKNFALTGAAGYIAPRHLKAIKDTGNNLVAVLDPHDSVGILDRYFPQVSYFREFERFDRHIEKLKREGHSSIIDYVSICSPNHLHDAQIRFALRSGADAICEKPLVLNPWNLDALLEIEKETGKNVYTILQLRVHEALLKLKKKIDSEKRNTKHNVCLSYITSRGPWYHYSWKGDIAKSGGIGTNIGIHFFDMLIWLFGSVQKSEVHINESGRMAGFLELEKAYVPWYLSINKSDLPKEAIDNNQPTFRSITIDNEEIEFTKGFTDLHTTLYKETINGNGFGIETAYPSVKLAYEIRNAELTQNPEVCHPMIKK